MGLHVLFAVVTQRALQAPAEQLIPPDDTPLQIRFVSILTAPAPPPPPPPSQAPVPTAARAAPAHQVSRVQPARASTAGAPASSTPLRLYAADGRILLPATAASSTSPLPDTLKGNAQIMRKYDPLHYKATRFEPYFPPLDESAGQAAVRRAVDTVVKTKEIDLPRGIHMQCKTVLGIPTPDCKIPPPSASPKAGDERLSMAPAGAMSAPGATPPSVDTCIKIYRAGKPLPWGCPVDTPTRAVDAELKERHGRTEQTH